MAKFIKVKTNIKDINGESYYCFINEDEIRDISAHNYNMEKISIEKVKKEETRAKITLKNGNSFITDSTIEEIEEQLYIEPLLKQKYEMPGEPEPEEE